MTKNSDKTRELVLIAMFSAVAYVAAAVCTSLPKVGGFLTLDIKDAVIVLSTLIFGPVAGISISILVPLLEMLTFSTTGWYGLVMNILSSMTFSLVTGLIYKYKRSFYGAIIALASGVFSVTAVMMLANLLITPLYLTYVVGTPSSMADVAKMIPAMLLPFNFTKASLNGALVLLLYKPLSGVLKKANMVEYTLSDKQEKNKFNLRSVIVTVIAVAIIIAALCVIFIVLNKKGA